MTHVVEPFVKFFIRSGPDTWDFSCDHSECTAVGYLKWKIPYADGSSVVLGRAASASAAF